MIPEQVWDPPDAAGLCSARAPARRRRWPGRWPRSCGSPSPSTRAGRSRRPPSSPTGMPTARFPPGQASPYGAGRRRRHHRADRHGLGLDRRGIRLGCGGRARRRGIRHRGCLHRRGARRAGRQHHHRGSGGRRRRHDRRAGGGHVDELRHGRRHGRRPVGRRPRPRRLRVPDEQRLQPGRVRPHAASASTTTAPRSTSSRRSPARSTTHGAATRCRCSAWWTST